MWPSVSSLIEAFSPDVCWSCGSTAWTSSLSSDGSHSTYTHLKKTAQSTHKQTQTHVNKCTKYVATIGEIRRRLHQVIKIGIVAHWSTFYWLQMLHNSEKCFVSSGSINGELWCPCTWIYKTLTLDLFLISKENLSFCHQLQVILMLIPV